MSDEEVDEWVDGLTQAQYRNLVEFFETMPRLTHTFQIQNTRH
jgi:hypothetical protein